jgi:hypothetical protein
MPHPKLTTRASARATRASPKRYRLTPAGLALLARDDALRGATIAGDLAAKNRQAIAQLRAVKDALILSGWYRPLTDKKP